MYVVAAAAAETKREPTCNSKSVCSKRGPVMATARGRWVRDQISARFGAWATAVGAGPSVVCGAVWVWAVVLVVPDVGGEGAEGEFAASNCRAVVLNPAAAGRFVRSCCRAAAATRRREAYIVWAVVVGYSGGCGGLVFGPGTRRLKRQLAFSGLALALDRLAGASSCGRRRRLNLGRGRCKLAF